MLTMLCIRAWTRACTSLHLVLNTSHQTSGQRGQSTSFMSHVVIRLFVKEP